MLGDIRFALRSLRRNPGFTATALAVFAIGIGANTAAFSVVYGVLLRPLPYRNPERLVVALRPDRSPVSPADFLDYRRQATAFDALEAAQGRGGEIQTSSGAQMIQGIQVTSGMFSMLGVSPELGRLFSKGEDQPGAAPVLIISHRLWVRRFERDPDVIGRAVRVNDQVYNVIGVMPPEFQFAPFWITQAQMWSPLDLSNRRDDRSGRSLRVFGRLKSGVGIEEARAQLEAVAKRLEERYPGSNKGITVEVSPLLETVTGPVRPTLLMVLGTALFVLLIACVNLANLFLTRGLGRRGETALRLAIGASRPRILRELATETLLVCIAGGAAGVVAARWCLRLLPLLLPADSLPRLGEIRLLPVSLAFAAAASVLVAIVCGLFCAAESARVDVNEHLRQTGHGVVRAARARGRDLLIAAEISIALLLLACAGLMIRTVEKLDEVNPGFEARNLLSMYVFAPAEEKNGERRIALFERVRAALERTPGVERVSGVNQIPIGGDVWGFNYLVVGRPAPAPGDEPSAVYRVALPGYFGTMRIPILHGREFSDADNRGAMPVVMVNQALARKEWPEGNAIGQSLEIRSIPDDPAHPHTAATRFTIVGVTADVRQGDWTHDPEPEFYVPWLQHASAWDAGHIAFVARTRDGAGEIGGEAERRVRAISPEIAVSDVAPMEEVIGDRLWRTRTAAALLTIFAGIALALAAVGVYGVISYSMRQRAREIGIRLALGAPASHILGIGLRESGAAVISGMAVGLAGALVATRLIATLLYRVPPADPATFATVALALGAIAAIAAVVPALRALRRNREIALRQE